MISLFSTELLCDYLGNGLIRSHVKAGLVYRGNQTSFESVTASLEACDLLNRLTEILPENEEVCAALNVVGT